MRLPDITLQHAVVRFPVFPSQSLPEARRFSAFVTLVDGHLAAAVQPRLQRTPAEPSNRAQMPSRVLVAVPVYANALWCSLLFDPEGGGVADAPRVLLRLAAAPQVDDGLVDVEQNHGSSGAQAAAVAGHLQQVAFHRHVPTHTVETPFTWKRSSV